MREKKLSAESRRWRLAVVGGLLGIGVFAMFRVFFFAAPEGSAPTTVRVGRAETPTSVAAPNQAAPLRPEEDAPAHKPTVGDLALRCADLLDQPPDTRSYGYPRANSASADCRGALDACFMTAPAAESLFPLARPLVWSDVFEDAAASLQRVATAIEDPLCQVADDELRPELAERCAARDLAELAVFADMCTTLTQDFDALGHYGSLDGEGYLSTLNAEGREEAIANLNAGNRYTGNIAYLRMPRAVDDALNAPLVDQAEYWRQRERVDEVFFRTAWAHSRCERERETLSAMLAHAEKWGDLMARAAGFGDEFALNSRQLSRERALQLRETNLPLAWVHLAALAAADVEAERDRAENRALDALEDRPPHFQNRLRALEMAGIECAPPCTPERLRHTEKRFDAEIRAFNAKIYDACDLHNDCATLEALIELEAPLSRAMDSDEMDRDAAARASRYGKRAEAIRMQYTFAVEALAAARGTPVRADILRRVLANPDAPWRLDATDIENLRNDAERLVAAVLAENS